MLKPKHYILVLLPLLLLAVPFLAEAKGLVPCGGVNEDPCDVQDIFILIARVTNFLIALAGMYAVYVILGAAFWMVVSNGNTEAMATQRKTITNAIVGFVFAMMGYLFINTAVNLILLSKCKVDLRNPLMYVIVTDPDNYQGCKKPVSPRP